MTRVCLLFLALAFLLPLEIAPKTIMGPFRLQDVVQATGGTAHRCDGQRPVQGVSVDSRQIVPGELFWALRGPRHDGHDFVAHALQRGAAAGVVHTTFHAAPEGPLIRVRNTLQALWDFSGWHRARSDSLVIGVTGSYGKTTTREMIFHALSAAYEGLRSPRNYNNHVGVPLSLLELSPRHEFAVVELGASARGEIRDLAHLAAPEIGVITGIGPAHLEGFGSIENILAAKAELLAALPETGFAVLAGDNPAVRSISRQSPCRCFFVGEGDENHFRATNVHVGISELRFRVDQQTYTIPVTGRQHVSAALVAIAIGREIGLPPRIIAEGLAGYTPPPGRSQLRRIGPWHVMDDTYNANPASMQAALELLRDWPRPARRLLVVGDMRELGGQSGVYHRQLGRMAAEAGIDGLLAYGEFADEMISGALAGGLPSWSAAECVSMESLLAVLDCWLEPGAVILVKGSRALRMERVVRWLEEQSEDHFQENTVRPPLRTCA